MYLHFESPLRERARAGWSGLLGVTDESYRSAAPGLLREPDRTNEFAPSADTGGSVGERSGGGAAPEVDVASGASATLR